jgi:hypothetical protein
MYRGKLQNQLRSNIREESRYVDMPLSSALPTSAQPRRNKTPLSIEGV